MATALPPRPPEPPNDVTSSLPEGTPPACRRAVTKHLDAWSKAVADYNTAVAELRRLADPGAIVATDTGTEILARHAAALARAEAAALEVWQCGKRLSGVIADAVPAALAARTDTAAAALKVKEDAARELRLASPLMTDGELRRRLEGHPGIAQTGEAAQHAESMFDRLNAMAGAGWHPAQLATWAKARFAIAPTATAAPLS